MFTFAPLDTYKISTTKKDRKFSIDYKVLVRLYQPIIGSVATCLYLTLESESSLNKNSKTSLSIARLTKLLQISQKQFNEAVETLKEYKLISYKANQKKANDYLFVLNNTLPAFDFFANDKFNKALQVVVDETYYRQVYTYFISIAINEDEYIDIEDIKLSRELTDEEFFEHFFEKYPIISSSDSIKQKEKNEILRLKRLFSLSYDEIENAILNSFDYVDNKMIIDLKKLNDFVSKKYKKEVINNTDEAICKTFDDERSVAYYKKLSGRAALLPSETSMIFELLDQYKISEGVLNVVINYYFNYGKTTLGNPKNYFIKIIEEMLINKVKTTLDAMNYFRNRNRRIQSYKENKQDNYSKESKPEIKVETPSKDDNDIDGDVLDEFLKVFGG